MSSRATLVLLAVAGALAAYVFLVEAPGEERDDAGSAERIFDFEKEAVRAIEFPTGGDRSARLVREADGAGWRFEEPVEFRADADAVDRLAGELADLEAEAVIENAPADRDPFGLGPASDTLRVFTDEGRRCPSSGRAT